MVSASAIASQVRGTSNILFGTSLAMDPGSGSAA
jgi:hypothetical protein